MNEMIERLTKIIADHTTECGVISHVPCADGCACQIAARKCVEALRVPTEAMTVEGGIYAVVHDEAQDALVRKTWNDMNPLAQLDFMVSADRSWRAMINAAMK